MKSMIVIGARITGVTTAYALAKRRYQVTVIESHRYAAMETSFANGGQLSACNAEVWNHPSTIVKALRWLLRRDAPLLVRPAPSWHKLSWFAEFLAAIPRYEKNTTETARLAIAAREHLFAWASEAGISFDHAACGILHISRDRAGADLRDLARHRHGVEAHDGLPALLLPDAREQRRGLPRRQPGGHGFRPLDRGRRVAALRHDPPAVGAAIGVHRAQDRRGQRGDGRGGR